MKKLQDLTKDERSLLLFFETNYVDHAGKLDPRRMNTEDFEIAKIWNESGFIEFGRVRFSDIGTEHRSYYVFLTEEAMKLAHEERAARAKRMQENRQWQTTKEHQSAG
jgi:hypothetical protein